ncbi:MAG: ATP-binding protein [Planctomycetes bacterium]|nr:ATP-binding protein [Planctomycetota bacterium]
MDLKFEVTTTCTLLAVRRISSLLRRLLLHLLAKRFVYTLELAVAEICSNLVRHGARGREGLPLLVRLELKESTAYLTIQDRGLPFDPRNFKRPAFDVNNPQTLPVSGLGLPLVHDTIDAIDYQSENGVNTITLVKHVTRIDGEEGGPGASSGR